MLIGIRPLMEALMAGKEIEKVFVQKGLRGELFFELSQMMKERGLIYHQVPREKLNRFTGKNHQGVIAFISPVVYQKLEDLLPGIFESGNVPLIIVLDRVTDVRNFGAIARSAECAGVQALVIPSRGSAAINEDAMKASAGALNDIPVCRYSKLEDALVYLKESGVMLVGASEKAERFYYDLDFTVPLGIVMGSEEDGISSRLFRYLDEIAQIPVTGNISSLNVSVASSLFMYEALRQRNSIASSQH
ncbi:MAG: 23S rRNA (guanosine(2251)-2'-O)-methyltransferase RlmB [Bacteroidetes bacterium]|nr:23S rRNA (guanosine(2251)-2'-O)-methyltransferase RlmB [Bacteroidota bacterium]